MDRDRTRYTHPDPDEIGRPIGASNRLTGRAQTEEYVGTLGPRCGAIVPIVDDAGGVTAMVAVGVTLRRSRIPTPRLPQILIIAAVAIALGGLGAWILSRYLRRVTLGYGPEDQTLFVFFLT